MKEETYPEKEKGVLKFWKQRKIFEKSVENRPENNRYVFYDGPPFATGLPHYGHILSSVIKDVVPRYFTMKGFRVERRWGWDCHGLPIENLVEKELSVSGKKEIERIGIDKFNQTAREMVLKYARSWKEMVERIGRWVEFDNSYKTMDADYMESVWWAVKQVWDKGLIYEGRKVLMYCTRCESPVSNAEVAMDNSYKNVVDNALTVKFEISGNNNLRLPLKTYFLAWTTTPWTLPGNVALAVGGGLKYVLVESNSENYILAKDLLKNNFGKKEFKVIGEFKGHDLVGIKYEPLYELDKVRTSGAKVWEVVDADFVTTEDGTGIVHTAVVYGEEDYELGLRLGLPVVPLIDSIGKFNNDAPELIKGMFFKSAEKEIIRDLSTRDLIFESLPYSHPYPHCWRCDTPLMYNAISAWFIDIGKNRSEFIAQNEKINWYPKHLKKGRFLKILESAPDWNISRNRYWATPLPFWKCEKDNCQEIICIGSISQLKEKAVNFEEIFPDENSIDLHRPQIDKVRIDCPKCGSEMRRIEEVVDCWVESASMPFAQYHYPFEDKEKFESQYPGQYIAEYIAQTRAWFYYMHVLGIMLFNNIAFENVVTTGTILNEKGEKLSKSKKNYPDPWEVIDGYGSDALRFYLMSSVVMQADNLFFNERELRDVYNKVVNILNNVLNFYLLYKKDVLPVSESKDILDRWIISRLSSLIEGVTNGMDDYNIVLSSRLIKEFINDLSTWWLRRSRERLKSGNPDALGTIRFVLLQLSKVVSPIMPFMGETIYQEAKLRPDPESVHLTDWPKADKEKIDREGEQNMADLRKSAEMLHSLRSESQIKVRQPIRSIGTNLKFIDQSNDFKELLINELNALEYLPDIRSDDAKKKEKEIEVFADFRIDNDLRQMGYEREVLRAVQQARKDAGLQPADMAEIIVTDEIGEKIVNKIKKQANIDKVLVDKSNETGAVASLSGKKIIIKAEREIT